MNNDIKKISDNDIKSMCPAYTPIYEERKDVVGYAGKEPIIVEKEILINEYCSLLDEYAFNCKTCPVLCGQFNERDRQERLEIELQEERINKEIEERLKEYKAARRRRK
jgi:hypothetical protein